MSNIFERKYNKYKYKYQELKQQIGGHSKGGTIQNGNEINIDGGFSALYIDIKNDDEFLLNNTILGNNIILNTKGNDINNISNKYKKKIYDDLDTLLTFKDDLINIDFLNNFNKNIHVDIDNKFEIIADQNKYTFKNQDMNYDISKTISASTGAGSILLLQRKDNVNSNLPKNMVLKVFNDAINIERIRDYMSLEIIKINGSNESNESPSPSSSGYFGQTNYNEIPRSDFDNFFNLNKIQQTELIATNNNDMTNMTSRLYLSCKNDNFSNEIIVNTIIEKICIENNIDRYTKYYNYYIAKINGVYKGCVIMDIYNGSLDRLIKDMNIHIATLSISGNDQITILQEFYINILDQLKPILLILKNQKNMFTHTDLKVENVFYKEIDLDSQTGHHDIKNIEDIKILVNDTHYAAIGTTSNPIFCIKKDGKYVMYKLYIADFDKSSISYKNIRFYNDYHKSHDMLVANFAPTAQTYFRSQSLFNFKYENNSSQYIIRRSTDLAQFEVFVMRYSMIPFYLCFDFQSLFISMCVYAIKNLDSNTQINKKFETAYAPFFGVNIWSYYRLYSSYKWADQTKYGGDFGKLLQPLALANVLPLDIIDVNNLSVRYDIVNKNSEKIVDQILISNKTYVTYTSISSQNKLILSIPFIPQTINLQAPSWLGNAINEYAINFNKSRDYYHQILKERDAIDDKIIDYFFPPGIDINKQSNVSHLTKYKVHYTGDVVYDNYIIFITNRYSKRSYLYEFDILNDDKMAVFIYNVFKPLIAKSIPDIKKI